MAEILADDIFKCILLNENDKIPIPISLKFVPDGPIDNNQAFVLDNGLAPNRQQAIIWTNADPVHWRIYVALGGDELMIVGVISMSMAKCKKDVTPVRYQWSYVFLCTKSSIYKGMDMVIIVSADGLASHGAPKLPEFST